MFFQLCVVLMRRRKSSCLDDSQSQLLSSVVNLLLGHQSHIFMHESCWFTVILRRLVFIVVQGFILLLEQTTDSLHLSGRSHHFFYFGLNSSLGFLNVFQCFHSLLFCSCSWPVSEGFLCLLTLTYESLKNTKAPNLHNDSALCLHITENLTNNQFKIWSLSTLLLTSIKKGGFVYLTL